MKVHLRDLQVKDAEYMLEWMTEKSIICFFRFDASDVCADTCLDFIRHANDDETCRHYAIADETDEYLGTISLKDIDTDKKRQNMQ